MIQPFAARAAGRYLSIALVGLAYGLLSGCAAPRALQYDAQRYTLDLDIDPATHLLKGRASVDLVLRTPGEALPDGLATFDMALHPELQIKAIRAAGTVIHGVSALPVEAAADKDAAPDDEVHAGIVPRRHRITLAEPARAMTLFVEYEGVLHQDVAAGEKPGEIHNFTMRAHVGTDGVYLAGGAWYPAFGGDDDTEDVAPPADYVVTANRPTGLELVGAGEPVAEEGEARYRWRSPYPLHGFAIVGGPLVVHRGRLRDIDISVYVSPANWSHAEGLLTGVKNILNRYEPLIGPYPARHYAVVENFFSSGFAFPTFTLLSREVIAMGSRTLTSHGYLDHELLHSWWGNGVFVDPRDGNWCESLTSYMTNYYGYVLDGDEDGARRTRRNYCHFLSGIKPENDKPLGTYGEKDGCGRGVAYQKGAMVFHMLARTMGEANFWEAMRQLSTEYTGRYASWEDIRRVCEAASGRPLESFFAQWVRRGGAPALTITSADYATQAGELTLTFDRGANDFAVDVPIMLMDGDQVSEVTAVLAAGSGPATVRLATDDAPSAVALDPQYHVFRKVAMPYTIPTTTRTRTGDAFASVVPEGAAAEAYLPIRDSFAKSFEESEHLALTAGSIDAGALTGRCVLILGAAVHDTFVNNFLGAIEFPVSFVSTGFVFEGVTYSEPGDGILVTVHHPDVPDGGITVVYGNSDAAVPGAISIPFYDRSLIIFKDRKPVVRHDFERNQIVPVTVGP
jgi:hypothetical protein